MGKQSYKKYKEEEVSAILANPTDVESYRSAIMFKLFGLKKQIVYFYAKEIIQTLKKSSSEFQRIFATCLENIMTSDNIEDLKIPFETLSKLGQINDNIDWEEYFLSLLKEFNLDSEDMQR